MTANKDREMRILNFRFSDVKTKKFVNRLIYYEDERIYDALRRRVQKWKEPGFVLVQSLVMPIGSGKTNAGIYSAKELDPDFDIPSVEDLTFTAKEFLPAVKNIKKGQAKCWDEGGLGGGDSRDWRAKINKTINEAMRLTRFKQGYIFIMLPLVSMLDVRIRLLCNIELEMVGVHHLKKESYGTFRTLSLADDDRGRYNIIKQLPIQFSNTESYKFMSSFSFPPLEKKVWDQYLKRKKEALENLDIDEKSDEDNIEPTHSTKKNKMSEIIDYVDKECQGLEIKDMIDRVMIEFLVCKQTAMEYINAYLNVKKNKEIHT